jgi:hypothetical protein
MRCKWHQPDSDDVALEPSCALDLLENSIGQSRCLLVAYFQSTPMSRHSQCPTACRKRAIAKTHAGYGLDCRVPPLISTSLENALMPSLDLDRSLVRYPDAVPYKHRQQRYRDGDERGPDENQPKPVCSITKPRIQPACCPERRRARPAGRTGSPHAPLTRAST